MYVIAIAGGFDDSTAMLVEAQLRKSLRYHHWIKVSDKAVRKDTVRYLTSVANTLAKKATSGSCCNVENRLVAFTEHVAAKSFNHEALNREQLRGYCLRAAAYIRDTHTRPLVDDEPLFLAKMRRFFETVVAEAHILVP